jgi:alpha-1,3-rhamnosyl/mannosyltransferase
MFVLSPSEAANAAHEVRRALGLPPRFVLAVGNLQPRKNISAVIEAGRAAGLPVCVAGRPIWGLPQPADEGVRWLGYVADGLLPGLYAAATMLCYPSLYEGFGLPVIEAMAAGCPVVCSDRSAMPEVAGGAAELVDPTSHADVTRGVQTVAADADLAAAMSRRGRQRAEQFRWTDTARTILDAFNEFAPSP